MTCPSCNGPRSMTVWVIGDGLLCQITVPEPSITDAREGYETWGRANLSEFNSATVMAGPVMGLLGRTFEGPDPHPDS